MRNCRISSHLLVSLQFIGIALSLYPLGDSPVRNVFFLYLSLAGFLLGVFTLLFNQVGNFRVYPEIKPQSRLVVTGPYRFIRHPMYTSLVLVISGIALWLNNPINYAGVIGVIAAVFLKARKEEYLLVELYPEYEEYIKKTKGFIPFLF
jgi:protein-S-isoprenylcysteine O-methyltransferase Ste14